MPLIIIFVTIILNPVERIIRRYYKNKAIKKLNSYKSLVKVAITGSFGKTSTKNILYSILSNKYLTHKTPASYNTMMGLSLNINQHNFNLCDISILEMGAFKLGEIKEMVKAIRPNIRVITEIGMQHLSTFKTFDNVIKAKFEMLYDAKETDVIVANYSNKYIRKNLEKLNNKKSIYSYGIDNGKYQAKNIKYTNNYMEFDIYEEEQYRITVHTKLLSVHNVLNIICVYAICEALKEYGLEVTDKEFLTYIKKVEPTEHRLSIKSFNNFIILDDSYSSNIIGFQNACDTIKAFNGIKTIITPGIVDGGIYDKDINEKVALNLIKGFDEICLVINPSITYIEEVLKANKISYQKFNSFNDAYFYLIDKYNGITDTVNILIENDLPDSFLER